MAAAAGAAGDPLLAGEVGERRGRVAGVRVGAGDDESHLVVHEPARDEQREVLLELAEVAALVGEGDRDVAVAVCAGPRATPAARPR